MIVFKALPHLFPWKGCFRYGSWRGVRCRILPAPVNQRFSMEGCATLPRESLQRRARLNVSAPGEKPMAINNPVPQKKSTLDTVANIAIIVVCAIAAVVLIRNQFFPKQAAGPDNMPMIEKGEKYAQLKDVVPAGSNRALVVAVQPGCHFCNDSMPFYKRLIDERNQKGSGVKFVAAVPSDD